MGCQHAAVGRVGAWTLPAKTAVVITNWQRRRLSSSPLSDTIFCQLDRCVGRTKMSLLLTLLDLRSSRFCLHAFPRRSEPPVLSRWRLHPLDYVAVGVQPDVRGSATVGDDFWVFAGLESE
jgi:hypothetical protein